MLRKILIILILLISLFQLCGCQNNVPDASQTVPDASPVEDFNYVLKDGEAHITGYTGTDQEIVIPAEIENRPVTTICDSAFMKYDLVSIYIPDSVKKIERAAFSQCKLLTDVRLSSNLETIGDSAFASCQALTEITIPSKVSMLPDNCFYNCTSLKKINLPNGLTTIGEGTFMKCTALSEISLPTSLKKLDEGSFAGCKSLKRITLPDNVTFDTLETIYGQGKQASPFDEGAIICVSKNSTTASALNNGLYLFGVDPSTFNKVPVEVMIIIEYK